MIVPEKPHVFYSLVDQNNIYFPMAKERACASAMFARAWALRIAELICALN